MTIPEYPKSIYPRLRLAVSMPTVDNVRKLQPLSYAELGCYHGATTIEIAKVLPPEATIYLFDYADTVAIANRAIQKATGRVPVCYGNSCKLRDSYCWSLGLLIDDGTVRFDYVFIDGAHTWDVDGFAFFLVDKLLSPGGHIEFHDCRWRLSGSKRLNPTAFPLTQEFYTPQQIRSRQVKMIVNRLVRPHPDYEEVIRGRLFRKIGNGAAAAE